MQPKAYVFVLDQEGMPLMPCNPSVARILLRKGEAFVRKKDAFTIQHTGEAFARIYPITLEVFANEERATFVARTDMYEVYSSEMFFHRARSKRATRARAPRVNNRRNRRETGGLHPWVVSRMEAIRRFLPVTDVVIRTSSGTRTLKAVAGCALDLRPEGKAPKPEPAENAGNAQGQESTSSAQSLSASRAADRMQPVFREFSESEIVRELFAPFIRRQEVHNCLRLIDGKWQVVEAPFIDDWTEEQFAFGIKCLQNTVHTGGLVLGAFLGGKLKGFASVEPDPFGLDGEYLDLSSIHVSADVRGRGMGTLLFQRAADWARRHGARKLYISSHPAVESQAFYAKMACVDASFVHEGHVAREPLDRQLEFDLGQEPGTAGS